FHHDPTRTDEELDEIEKLAKDRFAGAFAARDGQTLTFPVSLHKKR
ncbi:MAG: MBL fold metallo-hydrolase, partial [Mesorhizobium sp.]